MKVWSVEVDPANAIRGGVECVGQVRRKAIRGGGEDSAHVGV